VTALSLSSKTSRAGQSRPALPASAPASDPDPPATPTAPPLERVAATQKTGAEEAKTDRGAAPRYGELVVDPNDEPSRAGGEPAPKADEEAWKQIVAKRAKKNLGAYLQEMGDVDRTNVTPTPPAHASSAARIEAPAPVIPRQE
jgi:hypothetical protein